NASAVKRFRPAAGMLPKPLTCLGSPGPRSMEPAGPGKRARNWLRRSTVRPKKVILCVDDNERDLSIRAFVLESHGYKVVRAGTCDQALDILRVGGIDLVLSDLVLPRMDGNELIRQMKQINPEVPTILFSAQVTSFDRARYA